MLERLKELNITIPEVAKPLAAYVPAVRTGDLVYTSGQLPISENNVIYQGKVGSDLSVEEGKAAARLCVINCLAAVTTCADLDSIDRIVKITGYIQCNPDFYQQAVVLNGASELLKDLLGEKGQHARAAIGVNSLPLNAACEVEMIVKLK
ncbi:MAG: RidA family protein [Syntrophomonadaceae bacterium]|nr:RidA family protein [Syntrophomonadaceae bacterium]